MIKITNTKSPVMMKVFDQDKIAPTKAPVMMIVIDNKTES